MGAVDARIAHFRAAIGRQGGGPAVRPKSRHVVEQRMALVHGVGVDIGHDFHAPRLPFVHSLAQIIDRAQARHVGATLLWKYASPPQETERRNAVPSQAAI